MNSDLTFITNEENQSLLDRFRVLIKDTRFFDVLVGYFFSSGFYSIYKSLEKTEKIRILVGIKTDRSILELLEKSRESRQNELQFSYAETKEEFAEGVVREMEISEDNKQTEEGVQRFIEWTKNEKLEIRAYPSANIHAKLYIMTFTEGDRDVGRVITGSSNFTQSGLIDNFEFNVELKTRGDFEFAREKFDELWKDAIDVSEKYIETINSKTWLNNSISPYELYLKFLYEYFKDQLNITDEVFYRYVPEDFMKLEYQEQAVLNAKKILDEYGGVFISDVVGLGKTYISAMLANQLDGRTLVIAPPVLLDVNNPGSWKNVLSDFRVPSDYESVGKLDQILKRGVDKYKNIIIDEAHRFRTETTLGYEKLAQICRGKRVILVTATPYNNYPKDILAQIKFFQKARKSTIPGLPDLERFFNTLQNRLKGLDRQRDYEKYIEVMRKNAREIRDKILKYLMVRRTRNEVEKFFAADLKRQKLKFPEVADPEPVYYEFNEEEDRVFHQTIELITRKFTYARYTPLLYYKKKIDQPEEIAQLNMGKFMKMLFVKRLESSFFAFRNTLGRFINSYEQFLKEFEKGNVYVSKKHANKIFELLENDDEEAIQRLIDEDKARRYSSADFMPEYKSYLKNDLEILKEVKKLWSSIKRDPKLLTFLSKLTPDKILSKNKLIAFTESKETASYLFNNLEKEFPGTALIYTGGSSAATREKVVTNFDARAPFPKDDYRILVSTEVLSEGVNLHRSNVVINYDIPWNPTRMMQRVGRINRVDTKFDTIHTYTFFPTIQSNILIKLREAAEAKIHAFITLLGTDARLLTEGEPIESHELFDRLISKKTLMGEDELMETELKYLQTIRDIRENNPDLFEKVKRLPKKARTARKLEVEEPALLTYFRKGKLQKFFMVGGSGESKELDFLSSAKILDANDETKREKLGKHFYELLDKNKEAFTTATVEDSDYPDPQRRGRDATAQLLKVIRAVKDYRQFTEEQEEYLRKILIQLEEGSIPKQTAKRTLRSAQKELKEGFNPMRLLAVLEINITRKFLEAHFAESGGQTFGPREVILSEYLLSE
jgi:superfamily II DNA or RNA helicase